MTTSSQKKKFPTLEERVGVLEKIEVASHANMHWTCYKQHPLFITTVQYRSNIKLATPIAPPTSSDRPPHLLSETTLVQIFEGVSQKRGYCIH